MRTSTLCLALAALAASPASAFAPAAAPAVLFSRLGSSCRVSPLSTPRLRPALGAARLAASGAVVEDNEAKIAQSLALLYRAAETKKEDPDAVCDAMDSLEKTMRQRCRDSEDGAAVQQIFDALNGEWRLVFTTGTADTQKKFGKKVNYFPIKACQSFDTTTMQITNGIYLFDFEALKFFGDFEFNMKSRKVEFDFDAIAVAGLKFNLPKGKAAELGQATGLGSGNNKQLIDKKKKPFFNWISADANVATARGGGGGLALWKRV
mmetsp:Transcript_65848/g.157090  ORF Transcript_65848/g.157090 Transcript_65848/m.157090 type:complete len:264 (+) Transcript_65848:51-842(+)